MFIKTATEKCVVLIFLAYRPELNIIEMYRLAPKNRGHYVWLPTNSKRLNQCARFLANFNGVLF